MNQYLQYYKNIGLYRLSILMNEKMLSKTILTDNSDPKPILTDTKESNLFGLVKYRLKLANIG